MKKRLLAIVCTIILCISLATTAFAYTNHTQAEAVQWIKDRKAEGWARDYDGVAGPQCVDLIEYYFDYLVGYHLTGNAYDYAWRGDLPAGWTYHDYPTAGDIAVWAANKGIASQWGHVALVEWADSSNFGYVDVNGATGRAGAGTISNSNPSTYIHPDFSVPYLDIGSDFYAYMLYYDPWLHFENYNHNVQLARNGIDTSDPRQIWHFQRQSNGSYKITSEYDNTVLDAANWGTTNGTNVGTANNNDSTAQRWYIYRNTVAYIITPSYCNLAIDVTNGSSANGTNVQLYQQDGTPAQHIWVYPLTNDGVDYASKKPSAPANPTINVSSDNKSVSINWTESPLQGTYDKREYNVDIFKGNSVSGSAVVSKSHFTDRTLSTTLDYGTYTVRVRSVNTKYNNLYSDTTKTFKVENPVLNIGEDFYAYMIYDEPWLHFENNNHNVQIASNGIDCNDPKQIWHFQKQSNGSYKIINEYDGTCLEAADFGKTNGTNVGTSTSNDSTAQRWYVYPNGRAYLITPSYCSLAVNVDGASTQRGTNIQLWEQNGTTAQRISIYNLTYDGVQYSKPSIPAKPTINIANDDKKVNISWTESPLQGSYDKRTYTVEVFKGESVSGSAIVTKSQITDRTITANLEYGTYTVRVRSINTRYQDYYSDTTKTFKVEQSTVPVTSVTLNKTSLTLNKGETATLHATVKPDNATNKAVTWKSSSTSVATVDNNGKVTAVSSGTATISAQAGDCTAECTVTVKTPLKITKQPQSVTVPSGQTAAVTVEAQGDGLKYQWYIKNVGQSVFSKSSVTSNTYTVKMSASNNGRKIYCVITDKYGNDVSTNIATLSLSAGLTITKQPQSVTVPSGQTASVTVEAQGEGLKYQWYVKNVGQSVFGKSSVTTNIYTLKMSAASNGRQVYCVVTDKYGKSVTSNTATLSMSTSLAITKQPQSVTVPSGQTASVTVEAQGEGLKYQWYVKNVGQSVFGKSSVTTNTYSVKMSANSNGRQVYCVVTDKNGKSVTSNTATLSMSAELKITKQPVDVTAAPGATATVTVTATGDGLTYQWYVKNVGQSVFGKSSVTSNTYSVKMSASNDGRQLYCVVKDQYGNSVKSNVVTLHIG